MTPGLDRLRHIVVLMMENRSFDHMLGSLRARIHHFLKVESRCSPRHDL